MAKGKKTGYVLGKDYYADGLFLESDAIYATISEVESEIQELLGEDDEFVIYELVPVKRGKLVLSTKIEWSK